MPFIVATYVYACSPRAAHALRSDQNLVDHHSWFGIANYGFGFLSTDGNTWFQHTGWAQSPCFALGLGACRVEFVFTLFQRKVLCMLCNVIELLVFISVVLVIILWVSFQNRFLLVASTGFPEIYTCYIIKHLVLISVVLVICVSFQTFSIL